jgi:transcriptional regulator with XRE-family HTH domain
MIVGERLRQIREARKFSQGDIEDRTGLLRCYVSRVENGHTVPSLETLEKWAKALDVSLSQLFSETGHAAKPHPAFKHSSDGRGLDRAAANDLRRIEQALVRMKPRERAILVGIAGRLAKR